MNISPLELESIGSLPEHHARCVFWELDPDADLPHADNGARWDSPFDKEAWLSSVLLEWGTCGQLNTESASQVGGSSSVPTLTSSAALYAPPGRYPRAQSFPTAPVSADAVLLAALSAPEDLRQTLIDAVTTDLIQRGARAIEAFGRTEGADDADICTECVIPAEQLAGAGFEIVAPHHHFPRYRLELGTGLGWKAGVEGALEKLFVIAQIDLTARTSGVLVSPAR